MNIGIDIDGVITNIIRYVCDYGSKYFFEQYGKLDININAWSLKDMFHVTEKEDRECWLSLIHDYAIKEPARPYASEIIEKMRNEGNSIYIITARSVSGWDDVQKTMHTIIKKWLHKNHILYDKLIFSSDKLEICKKYNIDIMIEDKKENINSIACQLPVICFHENHNKDLVGVNIYRAYSWYDVYYQYLKIKKGLANEKYKELS